MGLDVSHDCWSGAYSSFNRFREELWDASDRDINVYGHWSDEDLIGRRKGPGPLFEDQCEGHAGTRLFCEAHPAKDPLDYLLNHSDCDGEIPVWQLIPLAERLEKIAPSMPAYGRGHLRHGGPRAAAFRFANGCRVAAAANKPVEFW